MWIGSFVANMFGDRMSYISLNCYIWGFTSMVTAELALVEAEAARQEAEAEAPAGAERGENEDTLTDVPLPPSTADDRGR
jgi:hypothetical protein